MGIRFDKDSRHATNGPMIFFSDPTAELSLSMEIEQAIRSRISFYAYRRPGDMMISFGASEGLSTGIGVPGFVVSAFLPGIPHLTIPYKNAAPATHLPDFPCRFPERSTTEEEYTAEINAIKEALSQLNEGKIVAARAQVFPERIDVGATFSRMCREYPSAFVFCFSTPLTGCWIGASPELLLSANNGNLETMALAGSRPAGTRGDWDDKNVEEQRLVAQYIAQTFEDNSISVEKGATFSKNAYKVEHICTPISGIPKTPLTPQTLTTLLSQLSPTPALCGQPRDLALDVILSSENFNRGCYGGFCGPYHSPSDFSFNVTLRCALVEDNRFCIFAGGGITRRSEPKAEWDETVCKSMTLLQCVAKC